MVPAFQRTRSEPGQQAEHELRALCEGFLTLHLINYLGIKIVLRRTFGHDVAVPRAVRVLPVEVFGTEH